MVSLGAAIVSMVQDTLRLNIMALAISNVETAKVIKTDLGRLGAQVISGIGFLGAGTIMRDRGVVEGLTTAASIWATGCIGLAIGWGFYKLAVPTGVAILLTLVVLRRVERYLIDNKHIVKIIVQFEDQEKYTRNLLETYEILAKMSIRIKDLKKNSEKNTVYYTLMVTKDINIFEIMSELSKSEHISQVRMP